jgi:hypothetical protein
MSKVFNEVFKGCDKKLNIATQSIDAHHQHVLKFSVNLSAGDFISKWKEFAILCKVSYCGIDLNLRWHL